ncbi:MAG: VIT and VWA domain-containing protein [Polyangiaceae bacterium]
MMPMPHHQDWMSTACLRTTDGRAVPLLGVALGGEVLGAHARLVLRQRYRNQERQPIEAVYTFPIPGDATLVGFAMECEGRRIEAEVKEREEAFQVYDDAIAKGHGAALLEQERPNIFTASVGNLLPGEETVVEVTFVQKLTADEGALRLMIPTLVAPKYVPGAPTGDRTAHGTASPTNQVPDADRISPAIGAVRYGLAMDLLFDLGRDVSVESPSHAIEVIDEGMGRKRVTFSSALVALDRDIVLVAEGAPGVAAGVVCDRPPNDEGTFALTLVPDLFEAKKRSKGRAVVFVVDVSGSMEGDSITQAKRALLLCLRHLSEGDLFDIVPFSSDYSHFSAQMTGNRFKQATDLVPFTQTTLRQADAFVHSLRASGGTEMLAPLSSSAKLLSGLRRDRVIVLLTDGQVANEHQIVDRISSESNGARVYTFGIGTNVSDWLLRELSQRTKGAVEFIHPGERIDEKVTAQFARATAARVDNLTVKWVGVDAGELAPAEPPALIDGEPWSVFGRYEVPGSGRAEIRGTLGGEPFFMEVPLTLESQAHRPALTSLWAGARVRDLEAVEPHSLGRRAEAHKRRIVDLCVRHGIASKHTSFVVVEKRTYDRRSQGMPETRAVPVNAPAGWAMFGTADLTEGEMPKGGRGRADTGSFGGMNVNKTSKRRAMPSSASARRPSPGAPPEAPIEFSLGSVGGPLPPQGAAPPPAFGAPPTALAGPAAPPPGFAPAAPPPPSGFAAPAAPPPPPAVGFGPPGAPSAGPAPVMAPAPSMAAPMRAQAVSEAAKPGLFERAKRALGLSREKADEAFPEAMPAAPAEAFAELSADESDAFDDGAGRIGDGGLAAPSGDLGALFSQQLASGLWGASGSSDSDMLVATTECLSLCVRSGVDSSHSVYGAQIVKAVEALTELIEKLLSRGEAEEAAVRGLLAAAAVSTGKRARGRLAKVAEGAKSAAVQAIASDVASQEAARKKLA